MTTTTQGSSRQPLEVIKVHEMILEAFESRDKAYAPYSNFHVGAALLCADGTIVGGCNVENASYGAGICAERTAIPKAISMGHRSFLACAVTSQLAEPSVSPCGICRQVLREFLPLNTPIFMLSSTYLDSHSAKGSAPKALAECLEDYMQGLSLREREAKVNKEYGRLIRVMSLEELLPLSFGPEHLAMPR
ncbi:cytidine deaminase-like protein [Kockovaella imperatae]|uniref:Cytidine deaminase n=1 Tax=Kockovaella imperatae TaxID=4999 RepID=A0A1Y1U8D9_9TREE|nr:cytidine deaminase-like protein [Kockovaella imperatae]ORX34299.1 cytidine deaminase-like protein [Kockovaella imperatae]